MQNRCPVGSGPSSNTWPKCASHFLQISSVPVDPMELSGRRSAFVLDSSLFTAPWICQKDGQPLPESYFVSELNNTASQHTQWYVPCSVLVRWIPLKGSSVPFSRVTKYCSGVSFFCQSTLTVVSSYRVSDLKPTRAWTPRGLGKLFGATMALGKFSLRKTLEKRATRRAMFHVIDRCSGAAATKQTSQRSPCTLR